MRSAVSLKTILLGIAVIVVSFGVSLTAMNWLAPRGSRKAARSLSARFQRARDKITRPVTTRGRNGACPSGPQSQVIPGMTCWCCSAHRKR